MRYGAWLRLRRDEQDMKQDALADMIGVDSTYVSKVERGTVKMPGKPFREKVNAALGIPNDDPVYLMTLPLHERTLAQMTIKEGEVTAGERLDRALLFASDRERQIIEEFVLMLDNLFPTEQRDDE